MNKVILMGRLTRNPDVRYGAQDNSMAVARFTLAVDRRFKRDGENTADFISCVAFGKTAEFFEKYTSQGTKLLVEGRIQTGSYSKQDGTKVYTTDVVVENVEFAESKASSGNNGQAPVRTEQQAQASFVNQQQYQQNPYGGQQSGNGYMQQPQQQFRQPAPQPQQFAPAPPSYEAAEEGFMHIPDQLQDEGLPFS